MKSQRIIYLMTSSTKPAEYENQERPKFCWTNPRSEMIGIWDKEWGDMLLKALVDHYPQYECEVWQPELRADKIYTAQLQESLVHRKFPAEIKTKLNCLKIVREIHSDLMLEQVAAYDETDTVFMVPASAHCRWVYSFVKSVTKARIMYYHLLNLSVVLPAETRTMDPVRALHRYLLDRQKRSRLRGMQALLTGNKHSDTLVKMHGINPDLKVYDLLWGMDLDFWKPVISREDARARLGIDPARFMILLSQRLVPEYQLDKFLEVIAGIKAKRKFSCYITGHGSQEHEAYLQNLARELALEDVVHFLGFVDDETLRDYLIAADLFATFPTQSAGSGGAAKANAVGIPVLLTNTTGGSYEFLLENGVGAYVNPYDYEEWRDVLARIINGEEVKPMPRKAMENRYDWKISADCIHTALTHWDKE